MTEKEFIEKFFIQEIQRLQENDFHYFSFILIGQAIETLGAFLDNKPFTAQQQSKIRFGKALNRLFPPAYKKANFNHWLYIKLRCTMAHVFIPGNGLIVLKQDDCLAHHKHLEKHNDDMVLIAEQFKADFDLACKRLFQLMDRGEIKSKKVSAFFLNFGQEQGDH